MAYIGLGELPRKPLTAEQIRENEQQAERASAAMTAYEDGKERLRREISEKFNVTFSDDDGNYYVEAIPHTGEIDWDKVTPEQKTMFEATRDHLIERMTAKSVIMAWPDPTAQDRQVVSFRQIKSIEEDQ